MNKLIALLLTLTLTGCKDSESYSFDEIINARINDDKSLNGREIRINSKMKSFFGTVCPASVYEPCIDPNVPIEQYEVMNEYGHSRDWLWALSCTSGIHLINNDKNKSEELIVDYREYTDFFYITENKEINTTILAIVEFTEEVDHCNKKIYKGTKITLSDGQQTSLLNKFISDE